MEYDYVITKPELNEDTLAHYGVMGMRWGIRKDVRSGNGSISKKTKDKIRKKLNNASYGKTKRMLNALEQLKSDYKGDREHYKRRGQNQNVKSSNRTLNDLEKLQGEWKKSAKKNNYEYNTRQQTRATRRASGIVNAGALVGGWPGALAGYAGAYGKHAYDKHKNGKKGKTYTSPYFDESSVVYRRKRR